MNTDPTIGSSGDATPTGSSDLTDRLHANLDYRATRVSVAAPPLRDILHRSRRRQVRRHAAGVVAGVGALTLSGLAVINRPTPDAGVETASEGEATGTAPPGTAVVRQDGSGQCPAPGRWYLGLRGGLSDGDSMFPFSLTPAIDSAITTRLQAFLTDPEAFNGKALLVSRTNTPRGVVLTAPDVVVDGTVTDTPVEGGPAWVINSAMPYRLYWSGFLGSMGPLVISRNDMAADAVKVRGEAGYYIEWGDGRAEVQWAHGNTWLQVAGQDLSRDELLATAETIVLQDDGGFEVAQVPPSLIPVVNTELHESVVEAQTFYYNRSNQAIGVTTKPMSREQYLAELVSRVPGELERRQVSGHDGWVLVRDGVAAAATWYDDERQAAAVVSVAPVNGTTPADLLDSVLADVVELSASDVQAFCDRMRFFSAPPAPADGSSSPWTGGGSSSPWIVDPPADGSSSPWTDTTLPGDGSSSVWTAPTTTASVVPATTLPAPPTTIPTSEPPPPPTTTAPPTTTPAAPTTDAPLVPAAPTTVP